MAVSANDKIVRGADLVTVGSQVKAKLAEKVSSENIDNMFYLTSAEYEALATKDPNTVYVVTDGGEELYPETDSLLGAFKGIFLSESALNMAYPSPANGCYAYVNIGDNVPTLHIFTAMSGIWSDSEVQVSTDIESVFSDQAKFALLAAFEKVAWINENGQSYIDTLRNLLLGTIEIESITAVYSPGNAYVLDTMSLDVLKQYLVVTAHYSNGTDEVMQAYDLSGTMTAGEQTVTVSCYGLTTSFTATITHNIAATLYGSTWAFYAETSGAIGTQSNGVVRLKCGTSSDVTNWGTWGADVKKTLWSAVNGKTVKVRIKVNEIDGSNYGVFQLGIYQNSSITSLGNAYCKKMPLTTADWVAASDGYYEQTKVLNISGFTQGSLTPGTNSTFGILCYARSTTNIQEIYDVQIIDITE